MHQPMYALLLLSVSAAASAQDLSPCIDLDEDMERLRCYDNLSGRERVAPESLKEPEFRYRWEQHLLTDAAREPFSLRPYHPSYLLFTHLQSFNRAPYDERDPEGQLSENEVKLNISFQSKLIDNLIGNDGDLWLAYTQTSYWQLFNTELSSPFRETDHNPEVRLAFLTDVALPGLTLRSMSFGLRHDSNGQAGTLSRSWNRVFADFQLARGGLVVGVRPWIPVYDLSDNPDIEDYYGQFDVRASWERRNQLFSATVRNPFDSHLGAELSWSFPISGRLRGLAQWYYGYGENLIDYNHKNNRISVGVLLSDWL